MEEKEINLGEKIKAKRIAMKLTRTKLCKELGIPLMRLYKYETNRLKPNFKILYFMYLLHTRHRRMKAKRDKRAKTVYRFLKFAFNPLPKKRTTKI